MRSRTARCVLPIAAATTLAFVALPTGIRAAHAWAGAPSDLAAILGAQVALCAGAIVAAGALRRTLIPSARLTWRRWSRNALRGTAVIALAVVSVTIARVHAPGALIIIVPSVIVGPAIEELMYRAMLPALLRGALHVTPRAREPMAIGCLCSLAFAAAHPQRGPAGFCLSVLFAASFHVLRARDGGIEAPILAHAAVNAVILGAFG